MLHFIGDFFDKTRASLARAAFKRDFLSNHKVFQRISLVKLKEISVLNCEGISDLFYKTRPSLARAAFKRDFLYNQKGRRSIAGMAQALYATPLSSRLPF